LADHPNVPYPSAARRPPAAAREAACAPRKFPTTHSFRDSDFSADAAAFYIAIVHGLHEHGRHDELAAVARFDLVIDLKRLRRRGDEEYRAVLADIDV